MGKGDKNVEMASARVQPEAEDEKGAPNKEDKPAEKEEEDQGTATLAELFMLADSTDYILMTVGTLAAMINGVGDPCMMLLFSESLESLSDPTDALKVMSRLAIIMTILGAVLHFAAAGQCACWSAVAKRNAAKLRVAWFQAILKQDIGWFDMNKPAEMPARIASSVMNYEEGTGKKLAEGIQFLSTFVFAIFISFFYNVYVALLVLGFLPVVAIGGALLVKVNSEAAAFAESTYARANAVAYETFASLRTVLSFNGTRKMAARYFKETEAAEATGIKRALQVGLANALMFASFILMYGTITVFGGWMLSTQIEHNGCDPSGALDPRQECNKFDLPTEANASSILVSMLCIAFGGQALGQVATAVEAFTKARKAIKPGVDVIKRISPIDYYSTAGNKPGSIDGKLVLNDVDFAYPSHPERLICNKTRLEIEPGTTCAIVGDSGSGKTTIIQLLLRFYDPVSGNISLDGHDLTTLNVKWLRDQISLVGQEPKLFSGTIAENIAYGSTERKTPQEIEEAAKLANAHEFIMNFPDGYDTAVGHGGSQLSGGQKQRVAIARALICNPKVLLLDEATSALDNRSEKVVQAALDKLIDDGNKRTTIVIAHRLSTVRRANKIVFLRKGRIIEEGTHEELMAMPEGQYRSLVEAQGLHNVRSGNGGDIKASEPSGSLDNKQEEKELAVVDLGKEDVLAKKQQKQQQSEESLGGDTGKAGSDGALQAAEEGKAAKKGDKGGEGEEMEAYPVSRARIWELNKPDAWFLGLGTVGAVLNGASYPVWGLVFAKMISTIFAPVFKCDDNGDDGTLPAVFGVATCEEYWEAEAEDLWESALSLGLLWIVVLALVIAGNIMAFYGFGTAAERLSRRIRDRMFHKYLTQEVGYFDLPENGVGAVTSRLAKDATLIRAKTGDPLMRTLITVFSCGAGIVVALVYSWPVALMGIAVLPFMGAAISLQTAIMLGTGEKVKAETGEAGSVVGETLTAMRTVASLSLEDTLLQRYSALTHDDFKELPKKLFLESNAFGLSVSVQHWCWALLLYWGAWVNENTNSSFEDFNIALFGFFFGLFGLGAASQGVTDTKEAVKALSSVFRLLDRETLIDPESEAGESPNDSDGSVSLNKVDFTYPSRQDLQVCNGYTLQLEPGTRVGLVGASGSGKSTALQLLERFYDPDAGTVSIGGRDVRAVNYEWMHRQIGFVGQEPVLFAGSVRENISLGRHGGDMTLEEVQEVARMANAHDFIMTLPEGYDTDVGDGGGKLSGGQKQRVSIARALANQPKILLLDEATSALDSESEAIVQSTLDGLMQAKQLTTIMIAHRLSTVVNMDRIAVVSDGRIAEMGTHQELLDMGGIYADLVAAVSEVIEEKTEEELATITVQRGTGKLAEEAKM